MIRPVWFLNFCIASDGLAALVGWAPTIHEWLDNTLIYGNAPAKAVCLVVKRVYSRFATFDKLKCDRSSPLWTVRNLVVRLNGLV